VTLQDVLYRTNRLTCGKLWALWPASSMLRRLDDRIRDLCARPVKSQDPAELYNIFSQLQTISEDLTRVMNRLKALYRGWGIPCAGTQGKSGTSVEPRGPTCFNFLISRKPDKNCLPGKTGSLSLSPRL
jgi:hypothetical protein